MKFGHHPNPAIDFCHEVDEIDAMNVNRKLNINPEPDLKTRVERAMMFRVGGDLNAISAKWKLREIEIGLQRQPTQEQLEKAAAAIAKEGVPKGRESAREYRLRLAKAALMAAQSDVGGAPTPSALGASAPFQRPRE